jgi:hypothetical protein
MRLVRFVGERFRSLYPAGREELKRLALALLLNARSAPPKTTCRLYAAWTVWPHLMPIQRGSNDLVARVLMVS